MSVATATVLPRERRFPHLLPPAPCTHPRNAGYEPMYGRINEYRDLHASMEDLNESEEEDRFRCLAHAPPLCPCSALYRLQPPRRVMLNCSERSGRRVSGLMLKRTSLA
ncbi:hypothetical protein ARMSODRAFT_167032 [Armillaria solidipes]|uniref:Uncharacterized protein n=1 Tax=Armillaria solidipes TaxID=1076256 RepID=A0A2H3BF86_9AGAR|nr:hypothetical protein ARMSODRAFT_167032 [Armillaria solidipes]